MENMLEIDFKKLTSPTPEVAASFSKWENDPMLIPLIRPNSNEDDLLARKPVTVDDLLKRIQHDHTYLIYSHGELIGEIDYSIDPPHVYKQEKGTAWIGLNHRRRIGSRQRNWLSGASIFGARDQGRGFEA